MRWNNSKDEATLGRKRELMNLSDSYTDNAQRIYHKEQTKLLKNKEKQVRNVDGSFERLQNMRIEGVGKKQYLNRYSYDFSKR